MKIKIQTNQAKVARGHDFMAQLRRGGKMIARKSRRTEKQKFRKEIV